MYYTIFRYLEIKGVLIMKTVINLKTLLSILSLVVLLFGSCKAGDKLGSVTQDSQNQVSQISDGENSGESINNEINTSLPIWNSGAHFIPQEYRGKYYCEFYIYNSYTATVTDRDITLYYKDDNGNLQVEAYFHVFDKKAEYQGNNHWSWPRFYLGDNYINKYKNDFRFSIPPDDDDYIITFKRNEKGQRVLFYDKLGFDYFHEDDMNK